MFLIELKVRRGTVARHPGIALTLIADRVTPPEVETVIFRLLRADVRVGPVWTTLPKLDFGVDVAKPPFVDCPEIRDAVGALMFFVLL